MILNEPIIQNPFLYNLEILNLASTGDALKIYSHFLNDPYYGLIPKEKVNFILAQATLRKVQNHYHCIMIEDYKLIQVKPGQCKEY